VRGELGGRGGFDRLAATVRDQGLGIIIDIVPNHMAASTENPWWRQTLERGSEADAATIFDIDWDSGEGRVVLPVLGGSLGEVLERREISIVRQGDALEAAYFEQRFPIAGDAEPTEDPARVREILAEQRYELEDWRAGGARRNYRRFFDIDELVGVRVEDEHVFARTHELVRELWESGAIDGVRVDHIDGMARPGEYLSRLRQLLAPREGQDALIYVEKILGEGERLPSEWPVDGTTGYETLNDINRVFVSRAEADRFGEIARTAGASDIDGPALVLEAKREIARTLFAGELARLAVDAAALAGEPNVDETEAALVELMARLEVYRTYLGDGAVRDPDERRLRAAAAGNELAERVVDHMIGGVRRGDNASLALAQRLEQLSGPLMAKGLEDTAHYRCATLTALNEVGGEPGLAREDPIRAFHEAMAARAVEAPAALTPLTTHDAKRSEDARARILALAEAPEVWANMLEATTPALDDAAGRQLATEDAVFLLQAAVGIWPEPGDAAAEAPDEEWVERLADYAVKAVREGKRRSSWRDPDEDYEAAMRRACSAVAASVTLAALVGFIEQAAARITLAQTALRIMAPGVPDLYQGAATVQRSLVDPDNRRPVPWDDREARLARLERGEPLRDLGDRKLELTRRLGALRTQRHELFSRGGYERIAVATPGVLAFERRLEEERMIVAVAARERAMAAPTIELPIGGLWRDALSERVIEGGMIAPAWDAWPVLVLEPAS
jgi:(1->4)-alpha-D-glucan 1-alpha-D-glucosylmutase